MERNTGYHLLLFGYGRGEGYHEYHGGVQYHGGTQITKGDIPHMYHDIPYGTQDIPHSTEDPPRYSRYLSTVLNIPHGTEHTLCRAIILVRDFDMPFKTMDPE